MKAQPTNKQLIEMLYERLPELFDRAAAQPAAPKGWKLEWTENRPPCEKVRYDHCIAETPFGRFMLTWKGWKEHDPVCADETPWNEFFKAFDTLEEAKAECEAEYLRRILLTTPPAAQQQWVELTDDEKRQIYEREDYQGWLDYINAIEAKLKEKNT
jgi:hypothetical protein